MRILTELTATSFMLKHIVHSKALHNRKTFEIKLPPLPASESKLFFNNLRSDFEIAKFLMVFGGIPKYLEQIDPRLSFSENVDRLCFQKNGFFGNRAYHFAPGDKVLHQAIFPCFFT